jgi:hypothetical protein
MEHMSARNVQKGQAQIFTAVLSHKSVCREIHLAVNVRHVIRYFVGQTFR